MIAHIAFADRVRRTGALTVHFVPTPAARLGDLLVADEPVTELQSADIRYPISLVSIGSPYVFIAAASLGVRTQRELFANDRQLYDTLATLPTVAAGRLGSPLDRGFPEIAAVGQFHSGRLAVRTISARGWQPTFALTGAVCLGVATIITGTIPYQLTRPAGSASSMLTIDAPGTLTAVTVQVSGTALEDRLLATSVTRKHPPNECRSRWSHTVRLHRHQADTAKRASDDDHTPR